MQEVADAVVHKVSQKHPVWYHGYTTESPTSTTTPTCNACAVNLCLEIQPDLIPNETQMLADPTRPKCESAFALNTRLYNLAGMCTPVIQRATHLLCPTLFIKCKACKLLPLCHLQHNLIWSCCLEVG